MDAPTLNRTTVTRSGAVDAPEAEHFAYPERVLQFGTGAFLRGFAGYFVEQANRAGALKGRVVMVGSTGSGRAARFNEQDGLYTLVVRGREDGAVVDRTQVVAAVSRALASREAWGEVLEVAASPDLALVISNTTEVGIRLDEEDRIDLDPPRSFPGKLTAVLHARARAFDYDPGRGLVVLPCELVEENGTRLRSIVRTLAERWSLGPRFLSWLDEAVVFCNTLVDRIVPGTPEAGEGEALRERLGYDDALLTVAEPYRLWAIEGDDALAARLPLTGVDPGIVVADDITPYRERKVRILNGTHTVMTPLALLCGVETVAEAVDHPLVGAFVRGVLYDEIVPSLDVEPGTARAFADDVLERFANPFIRHELLGITFQQTTKMRVRVLPSLLRYVDERGAVPPHIAFGFACFLLFQHPAEGPPDAARPADDVRPRLVDHWAGVDLSDAGAVRRFVGEVCADEGLWSVRLDAVPGFADAVSEALVRVAREGAAAALEAHLDTVNS